MLNKLRKLFAYHIQAALSSFHSLCRRPLATAMTVLVIAITLVLPALFWVMTDNVSQLTAHWKQGGHISLYLKSSLPSEEELALLVRVRATAGVAMATLKSSSEGLKELQKQEGMQDIMRYLPDNPLPATIEVTPAIDINTPQKLEALYMQLKDYPQVEQAKFDIQWVNRLQAILGFIAKLAEGLMLILAVAVVLIIGNTLRLAVHSRYEEIQVLKLIGAKDSFIIRPFLYAGIWYGLAGAMVAILLLNIFMLSLTKVMHQLAAVYEMHYTLAGLSLKQSSYLILVAVLLGWLAAHLSVKRQLSGIEP
jgi:cell division transport system permease protein